MNYIAVNLKICESCGVLMVRQSGKYCGKCVMPVMVPEKTLRKGRPRKCLQGKQA